MRNNLELARDSLFIKKIRNAYKTTGMPSVQDAYAIITANEFLTHPLPQNLSKLFEIKENFNRRITEMQCDLNSPFVLRINAEHYRSIIIHVLLKFLDRNHRKNCLGFSFSRSF